MINKYKILVGKPLKKRSLGATMTRREDNIKMTVLMKAGSE
jgi:hypothetical protein